MGTTGSFDLDLNNLGGTTNNAIRVGENVIYEIMNQGSLIGLAIAISIALTLIFGAIFLIVNFVPKLIGKVKAIK